MGCKVHKTEYNGAKHGRGALWGTKYEAKSGSKKVRRRRNRQEIREAEPELEDQAGPFRELATMEARARWLSLPNS